MSGVNGRNGSGPKAIVVGTGFGCRIQVPALRAAGFDVAGLVGTDQARTEERAARSGVPAWFTDLGEAIDSTGATLAAIATPPAVHAQVTLDAIAQGCHVLCEKPFAADAVEAQAMLDAAEQAERVHIIGHEFRYMPQRALCARAIADGLIGQPRMVTLIGYSSYVSSFSNNLPVWWLNPAVGGGWLGASGSHIVDQIRSELGEFAAVSAGLPRICAAAREVEDSFDVRFTLADGTDGIIQQSAGAFGTPEGLYRVAGTEGTLWTDGDAVMIADAKGERALDLPEDLQLTLKPEPSGDARMQSVEWQFLSSIELEPYAALCAAMRAAIEGKPSPGPVSPATFADGVACMKVIDAIRHSAAEGGALVTLN